MFGEQTSGGASGGGMGAYVEAAESAVIVIVGTLLGGGCAIAGLVRRPRSAVPRVALALHALAFLGAVVYAKMLRVF